MTSNSNKMSKIFRFAITALVAAVLLTACATALLSEPMLYTITYCSADNEPVWVERVKFDQSEVMEAGILTGPWKNAGKAVALFPPPPVPKEIYVYWFNYRQQVFYEATVPLKKNAAEIMRTLPKSEYEGRPYITTGVLPDGKAVVWISNGPWPGDSTWIEVGRSQGKRAAGNPNDYKSQTEDMRKRGEI